MQKADRKSRTPGESGNGRLSRTPVKWHNAQSNSKRSKVEEFREKEQK